MAKNKRTRRLSQSERRQQLLDCALLAAARMGLARFTHAEVAKEGGVSVPTVFLYFSNRTELVTAVVEETKRYYLEQGNHWHRPEILGDTALRGHLHAFAESVETHPQYAQIWLEWSISIHNEGAIWDSFLDYQEKMVALVAGSLRRGQKQGSVHPAVKATESSRLICASAYTITQMYFMRRDRRAIRRFIDQVLHLAMHDLPPNKQHTQRP